MLAQSVERVTLNIFFGRIKVITRLGVRAPRRALFFIFMSSCLSSRYYYWRQFLDNELIVYISVCVFDAPMIEFQLRYRGNFGIVVLKFLNTVFVKPLTCMSQLCQHFFLPLDTSYLYNNTMWWSCWISWSVIQYTWIYFLSLSFQIKPPLLDSKWVGY